MTEWKQREILFRGVRQDTKKWVYGFLHNQHCIYSYTSGMVNGDFYMIFPGTGTQYTGLKDINGKKIFEGDIVTFGIWTGVVIFQKAGFCIKIYDSGNVYIYYDIVSPVCKERMKILGNVFQNPELVEKYKLEIE